jgi:hypothetical protein
LEGDKPAQKGHKDIASKAVSTQDTRHNTRVSGGEKGSQFARIFLISSGQAETDTCLKAGISFEGNGVSILLNTQVETIGNSQC